MDAIHVPDGTLYTTPAGLRRLEERLRRLRSEYLAVCADNADAAGSGDTSVWHDNFAYEHNQREMHRLARAVRDLERAMSRLEVVDPPSEAPERVVLGARVTSLVDGEEERTAVVAGWADGDPKAGRVSYLSPLARALLGARVGEERTLRVGGRERTLEVVAIEAAPEGEL